MRAAIALLALGCYPGSSAMAQSVELDKLTATDGATEDQLGVSVDIDSERIIAGAWADDGTFTDQGAAYIYVRNGNTWQQEAKITPSDPGDTDLFGISVAIDGDTAAIGAYVDDDGFVDQGRVEIWVRSGTTWSFQAKLVPSDPRADQWFGGAIALEQDTLVVGAQFDEFRGAAYVFERSGTTWSEFQKLASNDLALNDQFGVDVAIDGARVVVGACGDQDFGADTGSIYVFERSSSVWGQTTKLLRPGASSGDLFGTSVAIDGDRLVAGAPGNLRAEVFVQQTSSWLHEWTFVPSGCFDCDLGGDVDIQGDLIVLALETFSLGFFQQSGRVRVYERRATSWLQRPGLQAASTGSGDLFGSAVALDGFTLAIGQRGDDDVATNAGAAIAYDFVNSYTPFCFGGGGSPPGCTACPCGNDAAPDTAGGCFNAFGGSASLLAEGNPSQSDDSLRFTVVRASPARLAILSSADSKMPDFGPCPAGSGIGSDPLDGLRCIGGNLRRHGIRVTDNTGTIGNTNRAWGPLDGPVGGLLAQGGFVAGQTRQFQVFYREGAGLSLCGTGQNTTNGVSVTFRP